MTTSRNIPTHTRRNPIALLDQEWQRLNHSPRVLRQVNSWGIDSRTFQSLDEVLVAAGYRGKKIDTVADGVLAALVKRAANDELAARIVLQRVVPPMVSIARRRGRLRSIGYDDALGMVLSHAWEVIRTYPSARRPTKIAVNIVRDIEYFAFVRGERKRVRLESVQNDGPEPHHNRSADLFSHEDPYGTSVEGATSDIELEHLLTYARECGVSADTLELCEELRGQSLDDFAAKHDITPRTAKSWMKQAANELRVRTQCAA